MSAGRVSRLKERRRAAQVDPLGHDDRCVDAAARPGVVCLASHELHVAAGVLRVLGRLGDLLLGAGAAGEGLGDDHHTQEHGDGGEDDVPGP